jgi:hypothetical protein
MSRSGWTLRERKGKLEVARKMKSLGIDIEAITSATACGRMKSPSSDDKRIMNGGVKSYQYSIIPGIAEGYNGDKNTFIRGRPKGRP